MVPVGVAGVLMAMAPMVPVGVAAVLTVSVTGLVSLLTNRCLKNRKGA
jgi:hypothetical protein